MKNLQLSILSSLIFSDVNAQNDRPVKPHNFQSPRIFVIPPGSNNSKNIYALNQHNKATFLYNTGKGKLYRSFQQGEIPGIKKGVTTPMPNALPRSEIIPAPTLTCQINF
ncbi:MAG: hypothetical protein M3015_16265 [Bacteroidota bacterium]|nr:hypothetical protein [Bacteroidota bacterium]